MIATVPAAPPSKLSKKLIELQTPTIHRVVTIPSIRMLLNGVPSVLVEMRAKETIKPAPVCAAKRGHGSKPFRSSNNPIADIAIAGKSTVLANANVCIELSA